MRWSDFTDHGDVFITRSPRTFLSTFLTRDRPKYILNHKNKRFMIIHASYGFSLMILPIFRLTCFHRALFSNNINPQNRKFSLRCLTVSKVKFQCQP